MSKYLGETSTPELIKLIKQNLATKQDLITNPVNNNLAGMDSSGQTIDSGISTDTIKDNIYDTKSYTNQSFLYRESLAETDCVGKLDKIKGNSLVFNQKVWNDGEAELLKIKGNTIVWNQLIPSTASSNTINDVIFTNNGDGSFTVNGTASANAGFMLLSNTDCSPNTVFYLKGCPSGGSSNEYSIMYTYLEDGSWRNESYEVGNGLLITNQYNKFNVQILVRSGKTVNNLKFVPQLFNLTSLGLSNLSLSEVKQWFSNYYPLPYYNYCQGTLISLGGRNVNFNQLVENGNFTANAGWSSLSGGVVSISTANNEATVTINANYTGIQKALSLNSIVGHLYYVSCFLKTDSTKDITYGISDSSSAVTSRKTVSVSTSYNSFSFIGSLPNSVSMYFMAFDANGAQGTTLYLKNVMVIDFTQMSGAGNEPTIEAFEQLFSDNYYEYTTGKWINLVDNVSIKTVSKNQLNPDTFIRGLLSHTTGAIGSAVEWITSDFIEIPSGVSQVMFQGWRNGTEECYFVRFCEYDNGKNFIVDNINGNVTSAEHFTKDYTLKSNTKYVRASFGFNNKVTTVSAFFATNDIQMEFGSTATDYEAYESDTLSLPVSTYFPDGMMSAGTVYDEVTKTSYIKRVGMVDMGSLNWAYDSTNQRFYVENPWNNSIIITSSEKANILCSKYETSSRADLTNGKISFQKANASSSSYLNIMDSNYNDVTTFKNSLQNYYLYYELATPLQNYGVVDLGTLEWTYNNSYATPSFTTSRPSDMPSFNFNMVSTLYQAKERYWESSGNDMCVASGNNYLNISNSNYSDATSFKSAMSGVYLLYEKTTPATVDLDLSYKVWNNGTEQLLPENTSVPTTTSLSATVEYPDNTVDVNYIYKQTIRDIILTNGHSYITKINGTWSNVTGTGQSLSVGDDDMVIDLTQMANPYITNYTQFLQYYPNDYEFEKGRLLSFTGTGLKTVGKNLIDKSTSNVGKNIASDGSLVDRSITSVTDYIRVLPSTDYYASNFAPLTEARSCYFYDGNKNPLRNKTIEVASATKGSFTTDADTYYIRLTYFTSNADIVQLTFGTTELSYVPYETSTLSLPVSTYFPIGMKSAGSVYDELIENKAITRIGMVDLGSFDYSYNSTYGIFTTTTTLTDAKFPAYSEIPNIVCSNFVANSIANVRDNNVNGIAINTAGFISMRGSYGTDASAFKSAMSGVYLYYELATPTETSATTNLVFDAYANGTEEILSTSTDVPPTSPIVTDMSYLGTKDTIDYSYELLKEAREEIDSLESINIYYGNETTI